MMQRMTGWALFVWIGCAGWLQAVESPAAFSHGAGLKPPPVIEHDMASIMLNVDLFVHLNATVSNLRLYGRDEREAPFVIRVRRSTRSIVRERPAIMQAGRFEVLEDNRIRMEYRVGERQEPFALAALDIRSSIRDFEKQVTVHGSTDGRRWTLLVEAQPIFDYSRFMDVRNLRVDVKADRPYGWYRFEIANITEAKASPWVGMVREKTDGAITRESESVQLQRTDFRVDRVNFLYEETLTNEFRDVLQDYPVQDVKTETDAERQETRVMFRADRIPLRKVTVQTADANFIRPVTLLGRNREDPETAWVRVAAGTLTRVRIGAFRRDAMEVELDHPVRFDQYRLIVRNADNPPLTITNLAIEGEIHDLFFLPQPGHDYTLYLGGGVTRIPSYDLAGVLAGAGNPPSDAYDVGICQPNPGYQPRGRFRWDGRRLMVVAVILAVGVLFWLIAGSAKKLNATPPS
ncbi:MAG: hypothetical protein A2340_07910 [Lentisphaerae bacterium RIFOXYB12_FULL_60_10]|nr:MAG: hypothetical protein A2340_07910 [Lentisphaerae bacterium RIFOXYB12_FULL_60_10]